MNKSSTVVSQSRFEAMTIHAERRMRQWQLDGEEAMKHGNEVWAQECFAKAEQWKGKIMLCTREKKVEERRTFLRAEESKNVRQVSEIAVASPNVAGMRAEITREGIAVKPGQIWKDLDRRNGNRLCKVKVVENGAAFMRRCREDGIEYMGATVKVAISDMHRRATGWRLIDKNSEARAFAPVGKEAP